MTERYPWLRRLTWVALAVALGLQLLNIGAKPTGYLHSWNQISTLSTARALAEHTTSWRQPVDSVTRLSWLPAEDEKEFIKSGDAFVAYEEFPLYHIAIASLSSPDIPLEYAGRGFSIVMFLLALLGFERLLRKSVDRLLTIFLFITSFPLIYYGQATMSDMSMLCCVIWFFALRERSSKNAINDLACCLVLAIGGLFKSYAIVFSLVFFLEELKHIHFERFARTLAYTLLSCAPVVSWHYFASLQKGHQEAISHSITSKFDVVLSIELYQTFAKMLFRYLGYLPAAALAMVLLALLFRRTGILGRSVDWIHLAWSDTAPWIGRWLFCGALYLLATADKLLHHDYYYLLLAPPLMALAARSLHIAETCCCDRWGSKAAGILLLLVFLSNMGFSAKHVSKALKTNPDVEKCADLLNANTKTNSLIGILTDVSRYNSLAYYGKRDGITIESDSIPLQRYMGLGMSHIVVNLPPEEAHHYASWIEGHGSRMSLLKSEELRDFKNRRRRCSIYGASNNSS